VTDAARPAPSLSTSERFARIIDGLCRVVAASCRAPNSLATWGPSPAGLLAGPVIVLIWTRLRRATARFAALVARVRAGAPPKQGVNSRSDENTRHTGEACPGPRAGSRYPGMLASFLPGSPPRRLPTSFGWLIRAVPAAACSRSQLQHLLSDPEITALLSAAPQIGRVLRPLCHMLAINPGPNLRLPARNLSLPSSSERQPTNAAQCVDPPPTQTPANSTPFADPHIGPSRLLPDPLQVLLPRPAPA
jgi:hypothetical protein